jgi:hypothetical protein
MKPKTFLILSLFLPYLFWIMTLLLMALPTNSTIQEIVIGFSFFYSFGILFWGVPYTTLVIGIILWSRKKSAKEVYRVLAQSPLWLALITLGEFLLVFFYSALTSDPPTDFTRGFVNTIVYSCIAIFGIFIYGYTFVFLGEGLYSAFERRKWIRTEEGNSPDASSLEI